MRLEQQSNPATKLGIASPLPRSSKITTAARGEESEGDRKIWIWVLLPIGAVLFYWLSIGPFFHWEQSAHPQKQYLARKRLEARLYAPLVWLEKRDGTRMVFLVDYLSIQPWVNRRFDYTRLPAQ